MFRSTLPNSPPSQNRPSPETRNRSAAPPTGMQAPGEFNRSRRVSGGELQHHHGQLHDILRLLRSMTWGVLRTTHVHTAADLDLGAGGTGRSPVNKGAKVPFVCVFVLGLCALPWQYGLIMRALMGINPFQAPQVRCRPASACNTGPEHHRNSVLSRCIVLRVRTFSLT